MEDELYDNIEMVAKFMGEVISSCEVDALSNY